MYFVWLRSREEQKVLEKEELLAQKKEFHLEEYVYRKSFEEKKELVKRINLKI